MGISTIISSVGAYYTRYGFVATIRRAALGTRRALFSNGMVLFCCDLSGETSLPASLPSFLAVEQKKSSAELSAEDLQAMTSFWNPGGLAHRLIKERFGQGALLWLIRSYGRLAGYGWTLRGNTIQCHYFPLARMMCIFSISTCSPNIVVGG